MKFARVSDSRIVNMDRVISVVDMGQGWKLTMENGSYYHVDEKYRDNFEGFLHWEDTRDIANAKGYLAKL